ncbi:lytic transglycosylase domain-containing protein [Acidithiobacillus ferrooxidans]|uniref:lytic transglycosylase domain-containing protein n=1 Tax=Acidithiobacillus ferrooxidans TaxID=920 RepID=UPI001C069BBB|nr:lytic transglycosylase domain-containing protein [Acidithiobacillus ferrooxidans]MBU2858095.1 lytic transglycosylase domain-containing protein [Acidithiobacillus ferrooxidans]
MDAENHPHGRQDEVDMIGLALLQKCAPEVAQVTMAAIVQGESGGDAYAINDNTSGLHYFPETRSQAVAIARTLIAAGHKIDMGLGQVDSENLGWLHMGISQAFDACDNLNAAQRILVGAYRQAGANGVESLAGAFEAYNSGRTWGDQGYAQGVFRNAGVEIPAIPGGQLAPWVSRPVGGGVGMEKERGIGKSAPVRPVIMMPPKSWQSLTKGEDFPVTRHHGKSQTKELQNASSVTGIWTAAR